MPRISKNDVNKTLELVGKKLVDAGGADKKISRADVKKAVAGLDGTEKKLVDIFFKFVDHRDFKAGAQVTAKDIQKAIAYAKEHMVAKYDLNANGLSKSEISKMSLTGKLAVDLAKALKAAAVAPPSVNASQDVLQLGDTWNDVLDNATVVSEKRVTTDRGLDDTLKAQMIAACHESTHDDVKTIAEAFDAVDQGEFVITQFKNPTTGKEYIGVEYGAGDNSYGAIFEPGKTTPAVGIHDGDLQAK